MSHGPRGNRSRSPRHIGFDRKFGRWLFAAAAFFYLLCTSGHIVTPDGVVMFRVTQSLVDNRVASITDLEIAPGSGTTAAVAGPDGVERQFAKYGLGLSLAAVPTYLMGRALLPLIGPEQRSLFSLGGDEQVRLDAYAATRTIPGQAEDFRWLYYDPAADNGAEGVLAFCAALTNSFIVAGIVLGVFLACRELQHSLRLSLFTAAVTATATPLWAYAKDFFAEPLGALGLVYFLYFALRGRSASRRAWFLAGLALGLAPLAKLALFVLLFPCGLFALQTMGRHPGRRGRLAAFAGGLAVVIAVIAAYNYQRFGTLLETGYGAEATQFTTPVLMGVIGLLASPGRGLLLYFPLWLLLIPTATRARETDRAVWFFAIGSTATLIGLYSGWHQWEGGVCWGPRFLIPVVPALMVAIAPAFTHLNESRGGRLAGAMVVAASMLIAFSGTTVNYFEYANWVQWQVRTDPNLASHGVTSAYQLFLLRLDWSPLIANWTFARWDYYFVIEATRKPGAWLVLYLLCLAGLLGSVTRLAKSASDDNASEVCGSRHG